MFDWLLEFISRDYKRNLEQTNILKDQTMVARQQILNQLEQQQDQSTVKQMATALLKELGNDD